MPIELWRDPYALTKEELERAGIKTPVHKLREFKFGSEIIFSIYDPESKGVAPIAP